MHHCNPLPLQQWFNPMPAMKPIAIILLSCLPTSLLFGAETPSVEGPKEHVVLLNDANTVQAEFRVGASGKIGIAFKFADGKTQTLLGVVKADEMKRTVEKDGKKVPVGTPMPDALIEFRAQA